MKKALICIASVLGALLIMCGLWWFVNRISSETAEKNKLSTCQIYILESLSGTREEYRVRAVEDKEERQMITELCAAAVPYRPVVSELEEYETGKAHREPILYFKDSEITYTFAFFDTMEQREFDYIYRDAPVILVSEWTQEKDGTYSKQSDWQFAMQAYEYSQLYEFAHYRQVKEDYSVEEAGLPTWE